MRTGLLSSGRSSRSFRYGLEDLRSTVSQPTSRTRVGDWDLLEECSCSWPIGGRSSSVFAYSRDWPRWVRDSLESQRSQQRKPRLDSTLPASTVHKASATESSSHTETRLLGISRSMRKTRRSRMGLDLCIMRLPALFATRIRIVGQPARSQNSGLGTMMK